MENHVEKISIATQDLSRLLPKFFEAYQELMIVLVDLKPFQTESGSFIRKQVKSLLGNRFWFDTPFHWLERFPAYFRAAIHRLEKLSPASCHDDIAAQKALDEFQQRFELTSQQHLKRGIYDPELERFRWMIEELRVSLFAQQLGTMVSVSDKRMEKQWSKVSHAIAAE